MSSDDDTDRLALAQGLMVEITARLEDLAEQAARLQLSTTSDPEFGERVLIVNDLVQAHRRLLLPRSDRARPRA